MKVRGYKFVFSGRMANPTFTDITGVITLAGQTAKVLIQFWTQKPLWDPEKFHFPGNSEETKQQPAKSQLWKPCSTFDGNFKGCTSLGQAS